MNIIIKIFYRNLIKNLHNIPLTITKKKIKPNFKYVFYI